VSDFPKIVAMGVVPTRARSAPQLPLSGSEVCVRLSEWAEATGQDSKTIVKSCLLDRLIHGGEHPSKTPCPVHKGRWQGIEFGHPGDVWRSSTGDVPAEVSPQLQKEWDEGCRCFKHQACSCTTGWQPDEACGCGTQNPDFSDRKEGE
jgi:hypothetical protein